MSITFAGTVRVERTRRMEPEAARQKLESIAVEFSSDSFFKSLQNGDYELVELFLDAGTSPDVRDRESNAAVVVAQRAGNTEIGRLLLKRGASAEPLLSSPSPKAKDKWDKISASSAVLSFISSLLIAAVGGYFTYSYNQRQIDLNRTQAEHDSFTKEEGNKVLELEAIQKLIPVLTSSDEKGKAAALTAIQDLAHPALAADLAQLFKGPGSIDYLRQAAVSSNPGTKQAAVQALSTIASGDKGADSQLAVKALATVFESTRASVLRIEASVPNGGFQGSGIIVTDRDVLTAAHVVAQSTLADIRVRTPDGKIFVVSSIKTDPQTDLALLRLQVASGLVPLRLGSKTPILGAEVIGIGYAYQMPNEAAFVGTVAAVDSVSIYFNATIQPGTSGGPLLDNTGEVIGIMHQAKDSLAVAVRSDVALRFLRDNQIIQSR